MATEVDLNFLKLLGIMEESKRNDVPQAENAGKETVEVEVAVAFSYFNNKYVGTR